MPEKKADPIKNTATIIMLIIYILFKNDVIRCLTSLPAWQYVERQ